MFHILTKSDNRRKAQKFCNILMSWFILEEFSKNYCNLELPLALVRAVPLLGYLFSSRESISGINIGKTKFVQKIKDLSLT